MKKYFFAIAAIALAGCIEPLKLDPDIAGVITVLEVEGQTRSSVNAGTRTVNIEVGDWVDMSEVEVTRIELVETGTCSVAVGDKIDLSEPLKVTVTTIADYEWTISATVAYGADRPLPGGSFEEWNATGTRPTWNPWREGAVWEKDRWWDTGNLGVNILGPSNSVPTDEGYIGRGAKLESRHVMVKAAGGNLYFGRFGELTGYDATCHLGHNWLAKPTGLKGWYKYFPQPIDDVKEEYLALHPFGFSKQQWLGTPDSLHVCVALWASPDGRDIPFTVNTDTSNGGVNFVDFSRYADGVIAYGAFISGDEQDEWDKFEIPIEYYTSEQISKMSAAAQAHLSDYLATGKLPSNTQLYLLITASKSCNYFIAGTGWKDTVTSADDGPGSLMYVDEVELVYD